MNRSSWLKVIVILLLAAALTGVSVAAAQQEEPATGDMPAVTDYGESGSPAASLIESEQNNRFNTADPISLGDVVGGEIGSKTDVDYFKIMLASNTVVMFDIDAQMNGSKLDSTICLYDQDLVQLTCNDDSNGIDSLIFYWLRSNEPYYVRIRHSNYPYDGGSGYTYRLAVYRPFLVSAQTSGRVAGIPMHRNDVLAHYDFADGTEKWMMFFDGSDVGVTQNVAAVAAEYSGSCLFLVLNGPQTLPIGGTQQAVTPHDVLSFVAGPDGHFGPSTVGSFSVYFRGTDYGLTEPSEMIDALSLPWHASTTGRVTTLTGQIGADEDTFNIIAGGIEFDGSDLPGLAREDVIAADFKFPPAPWGTYLTIQGSGNVAGKRYTQQDIFFVWFTSRDATLYWHGPDHHFNYNIDAFDAAD